MEKKHLAKLIWGLVKHEMCFGFGKATDIWKISWNNHQTQSVPKLAHSLETFYCDDVSDDWSLISFTEEKNPIMRNSREIKFSFSSELLKFENPII